MSYKVDLDPRPPTVSLLRRRVNFHSSSRLGGRKVAILPTTKGKDLSLCCSQTSVSSPYLTVPYKVEHSRTDHFRQTRKTALRLRLRPLPEQKSHQRTLQCLGFKAPEQPARDPVIQAATAPEAQITPRTKRRQTLSSLQRTLEAMGAQLPIAQLPNIKRSIFNNAIKIIETERLPAACFTNFCNYIKYAFQILRTGEMPALLEMPEAALGDARNITALLAVENLIPRNSLILDCYANIKTIFAKEWSSLEDVEANITAVIERLYPEKSKKIDLLCQEIITAIKPGDDSQKNAIFVKVEQLFLYRTQEFLQNCYDNVQTTFSRWSSEEEVLEAITTTVSTLYPTRNKSIDFLYQEIIEDINTAFRTEDLSNKEIIFTKIELLFRYKLMDIAREDMRQTLDTIATESPSVINVLRITGLKGLLQVEYSFGGSLPFHCGPHSLTVAKTAYNLMYDTDPLMAEIAFCAGCGHDSVMTYDDETLRRKSSTRASGCEGGSIILTKHDLRELAAKCGFGLPIDIRVNLRCQINGTVPQFADFKLLGAMSNLGEIIMKHEDPTLEIEGRDANLSCYPSKAEEKVQAWIKGLQENPENIHAISKSIQICAVPISDLGEPCASPKT
jgi:hypothetical protein